LSEGVAAGTAGGHLLPDLAATQSLGVALAGVLRAGDVVALNGDLGAGKSALARAVIQALAGGTIEVPSPTFTLLQRYAAAGLVVWHGDLYRLRDAAEVDELGLEECWQEGALLLEWPALARPLLPADRLEIGLVASRDGTRRISIAGGADWRRRLPGPWWR
jgi:tRNA threonylcarbamoyladenosine biosynthesis protein TsaE